MALEEQLKKLILSSLGLSYDLDISNDTYLLENIPELDIKNKGVAELAVGGAGT